MTPLVRPSTEAQLEKAGGYVVSLLIGLILLGGGGTMLYLETKSPPVHTVHVCIYAGIAILGALVIQPDPIVNGLQKVVGVLGQTSLPFVGKKKDSP